VIIGIVKKALIRRVSAAGLWSACLLFALTSPVRSAETWKSDDIGQGTPTGSSQVDNADNSLTIRGGGPDIWDKADGFHYVYQTVTGNAEFIARLRSLVDTADWAKIGLMVRQDNTEGSPYAMITQTPEKGVGFLYRATADGMCNYNINQNNGGPVWLRVVRNGTIVSGYDSQDGINWTLRGVVRLPLSDPVEIGMAVCSRSANVLCAATFDHISLKSDVSFSPASSWKDKDVGNTPVAGGVLSQKDECDLFGSGGDLWDTADSFHFLSRPLSGDGSIVVRVKDIINTNWWAKAGITFRENDSPGSRQVSLLLTPGNGLMFARRKVNDSPMVAQYFSAITPLWLKLTREGNVFSAYKSANGTDWRLLGKETLEMQSPIECGPVISSKTTDGLGGASFDHVMFQGESQ
jgi:regulation of enolase protein 1 (concanavalin A-like superfamily)